MNETVRLSEMRQGVCPVDHPTVKAGKIGVLLVNLGHPRRDRLLVHAALPQGIPVGPPRHRDPPLLWWPILNLIILTVRPGPQGQDYDRSGTRSGTKAR